METLSPALLVLDLPPSALAGIDLLSFTTAPAFRGIKALPSGAHFFFTAPNSTLAVRHGVWFWVDQEVRGNHRSLVALKGSIHQSGPPSSLIVEKWNPATETLETETDATKLLAHKANLGSLWRVNLTPYRQRATPEADTIQSGSSCNPAIFSYTDNEPGGWLALSNAIDRPFLQRVLGGSEADWHITSYSDLAGGVDTLPELDLAKGILQGYEIERPLNLMRIDLKRTWPDGATGRERTEKARDRSWYLTDLANKARGVTHDAISIDHGLDIVIAELQFSFLMALTLNNYACLEHWRVLIRVVLTCCSGVSTDSAFFATFLAALASQIMRLGADDATEVSEPATATTDQAGSKVSQPVSKSMEEQTEEELLRYDLPVRTKSSNARKTAAAEAEQKRAREEVKSEQDAARAAVQSAELRQLFLEDDTDAAGTSFLRALLVRFRSSLRDGGNVYNDVLIALSKLESLLFELYGWDFDQTQPSGNASRVLGQTSRPTLSTDAVDLDGYGVPDASRSERYRAMYDHSEDDDDDDDGEFAPAVVELSQAQLDSLGIQGTPSGAVVEDAESGVQKKPRTGEHSEAISRVVVDSSSEGEDDDIEDKAEDLDDTMDVEELDARY